MICSSFHDLVLVLVLLSRIPPKPWPYIVVHLAVPLVEEHGRNVPNAVLVDQVRPLPKDVLQLRRVELLAPQVLHGLVAPADFLSCLRRHLRISSRLLLACESVQQTRLVFKMGVALHVDQLALIEHCLPKPGGLPIILRELAIHQPLHEITGEEGAFQSGSTAAARSVRLYFQSSLIWLLDRLVDYLFRVLVGPQRFLFL